CGVPARSVPHVLAVPAACRGRHGHRLPRHIRRGHGRLPAGRAGIVGGVGDGAVPGPGGRARARRLADDRPGRAAPPARTGRGPQGHGRGPVAGMSDPACPRAAPTSTSTRSYATRAAAATPPVRPPPTPPYTACPP